MFVLKATESIFFSDFRPKMLYSESEALSHVLVKVLLQQDSKTKCSHTSPRLEIREPSE